MGSVRGSSSAGKTCVVAAHSEREAGGRIPSVHALRVMGKAPGNVGH